jgi:hypothetical protein
MNDLTFNIDHGYLEGLVRGFKAGLLTTTDYANLVQCETVDGRTVGVSARITRCAQISNCTCNRPTMATFSLTSRET